MRASPWSPEASRLPRSLDHRDPVGEKAAGDADKHRRRSPDPPPPLSVRRKVPKAPLPMTVGALQFSEETS